MLLATGGYLASGGWTTILVADLFEYPFPKVQQDVRDYIARHGAGQSANEGESGTGAV